MARYYLAIVNRPYSADVILPVRIEQANYAGIILKKKGGDAVARDAGRRRRRPRRQTRKFNKADVNKARRDAGPRQGKKRTYRVASESLRIDYTLNLPHPPFATYKSRRTYITQI